jgi:hypothetical protein
MRKLSLVQSRTSVQIQSNYIQTWKAGSHKVKVQTLFVMKISQPLSIVFQDETFQTRRVNRPNVAPGPNDGNRKLKLANLVIMRT